MRLVIYKTLCSLLGGAALHTGCGGLPGRGDPISAQEAPGRSHTFTSHSRGNGTGCGQAAGHSQGLRNGRNSEPGQGAARAECTCRSVSDPRLSRAFSVQEQLQVPPGAETLGAEEEGASGSRTFHGAAGGEQGTWPFQGTPEGEL